MTAWPPGIQASSHRDSPQRTLPAKCSPRAARTKTEIMQP